MYPLISNWFIAPGKRAETIVALKELAAKVAAEEPDTLVYLVHTPDHTKTNLPAPREGEVVFFEIYKDEAAFLAHLKGPIFTAFVKNHGHLFVNSNGSPYTTVETMIHHAGFIREAF